MTVHRQENQQFKENHGATRQFRQFDDRMSRFDTIPACDGQPDRQTDRQTDRRPAYI